MIRKYKPSDLEPVYDVWLKASNLAHPFLPEDFFEQVKVAMKTIFIPKGDTWVYEENDQLIAFIGMMGNEIGGLFALPDHIGKGIGAQLLNHIRPMHDHLEVEVFEKNTIGRGFYDKFGFKLMHQYFHEESGQEVLRLKLNP